MFKFNRAVNPLHFDAVRAPHEGGCSWPEGIQCRQAAKGKKGRNADVLLAAFRRLAGRNSRLCNRRARRYSRPHANAENQRNATLWLIAQPGNVAEITPASP